MSTEYADHLDFYTRGPYASFVREIKSAGRDPIRMYHAVQPPGEFPDPPQPDLVLTFVRQSEAPIELDLGAGEFRRKPTYADMFVIPPDVTTDVRADGNHDILAFILPLQAIRDLVEVVHPGFAGDLGPLHHSYFRDFFLEQLCQRLWVESEAGNPQGGLFADGALISVAATLLRLRDGAVPGFLDASGNPLVDRLRKRIEEYIDAHLDQSFAMHDLAALVDQTEAAFAQAFKAVFRQTPYQYVLSRRIARAQELLASGTMPLAEVAYACGFASQSHMTDVFRQKLGVAPGRYRKEVRG